MSDGIEYEGIAEDRSIHAGSDRCFRDYSPGDTVLSISDDGRAIYTRPMPSFSSPTGSHEEDEYSPQLIASAPSAPAKTTGVDADYHGTLFPATGSRRSSGSSGSSRTPMGRFRREEQTHEQLALQFSAAAAASNVSTTPPPPPRYGPDPPLLLPGEGTGIMAPGFLQNDGDVEMDLDLNVPPLLHRLPHHHHHNHWRGGPRHRGQCPGDIPLPPSAPHLPRSVLGASATARSAIEELHEMTRFMKSAEWEMLASEEQAKYIHEVFLLRRRVRAVELPRESKTVRVRKRTRTRDDGAKTDESQSGPSSRS